jgi:hypothetical protein
MRNSPLANSSLDPSVVNAAATCLPHDPALIRLAPLKIVMLLVVLFCARLFAQSEELVWMKAPDGRAYTTICPAERCEIHETTYALDLVDPQYVHDRKTERKTFCMTKALKSAACSLAFRREVSIQSLLLPGRLVSQAGDMRAMIHAQAEQPIDAIKK